MKKFILILIILLFPKNILSICTYREIQDFKRRENDIKFTFEYDDEKALYTLIREEPSDLNYRYRYRANLNKGINKCFYENNRKRYVCTGNQFPDELVYDIIGNSSTCNDILKTDTIRVTFKTIEYIDNPYYDSLECKGIEEFVLCQPKYRNDLTYEEFINRVNLYKNKKKEEIIDEDDDKDKKNIIQSTNNVINYIIKKRYKIYILIIFIILVIINFNLFRKVYYKRSKIE